jgi:hypothetical protein
MFIFQARVLQKHRMVKKIIFLVIVFFLSFIVSASTQNFVEEVYIKQGVETNFKMPCSFEGSLCSIDAVCNISVLYPNKTFLIENQKLTNIGNGMPNITIPAIYDLDSYFSTVTCTQDGRSQIEEVYLVVTSNGKGQNNLPIYISIGAIIFFILGLIFKNELIGFFSGILFLGSGMYFLIYGLGIISDLYTSILGVVGVGMGLIVSILSAFEWYENN